MCTINGTLEKRLLPFPQVGTAVFFCTPRIYVKKSIDLVPKSLWSIHYVVKAYVDNMIILEYYNN